MAVRAHGHFPNEAAAMRCVYMALMPLDPTGKGRKRWTMRWNARLNAFQIEFEGRLTPTTHRTPQQPGSADKLTHPILAGVDIRELPRGSPSMPRQRSTHPIQGPVRSDRTRGRIENSQLRSGVVA